MVNLGLPNPDFICYIQIKSIRKSYSHFPRFNPSRKSDPGSSNKNHVWRVVGGKESWLRLSMHEEGPHHLPTRDNSPSLYIKTTLSPSFLENWEAQGSHSQNPPFIAPALSQSFSISLKHRRRGRAEIED